MSDVRGHNGNDAGPRNLSFSVDGQLKFTFHDCPGKNLSVAATDCS
jgi:hypothetical protein